MITLAREARRLNQTELAERIGMSSTNLSKIERGDVSLDNAHLKKIASVTKFPVPFFFQPGSIVPENLSYRKRQKLPASMLTPIHAWANIIRQHAQLVTRALNIKASELPHWQVTDSQTPNRIAHKLRQKWGIDKPIVDNLVRIVEKQGIIVFSFPFGTERVDSKTIWTGNSIPVICLNSMQLGDRQRFSLAFELGQLVMHRTDVGGDTDVGHQANLFAAELLMPEKDIKPDFGAEVTVPMLASLKLKWKVSMIALLYRADDLGLMSYNHKRYLLQQFNQARIRRREPVELDIPIEQPRLMKQYIAQYKQKRKLSRPELAKELCLEVSEFLELYG